MNLVGMISTAVLSLTLVAAAPVFAQEQHDQQEEQKAKPEEKAQPEKSAKPAEKPAAQDEKGAKPEEKNAEQQETTKPAEKNAQQERQPAGNNGGGRIPAAKYQANFGREHTFHVSQGDYSNRRFQYRLYVWIRWRMAQQLAIHARCLCHRNQRRVLPVQSVVSRRQYRAEFHTVAALPQVQHRERLHFSSFPY